MRKEFFDDSLGEAVVQSARITRGSLVVDVGCGTGFLTEKAARAAGPKGRVVGVDISKEMLSKAGENLRKLELRNVEFRIGDAQRIPLDDNSAGAVIGNMILHHCPDPETAVKEMTRIVKPNGRIAISDLEKHDEEWLMREMADIWLGFELDNVKTWFERAGLRDVGVELARTKCCGVSLGGRKAEIGIFIATGTK